MGSGTAAEKSFGQIVADEMKCTHRNLAVPGFSGVQAMLACKQYIRKFPSARIAAVIYGLWYDHFNRNHRPFLESPNLFAIRRPYIGRNEKIKRVGGLGLLRYTLNSIWPREVPIVGNNFFFWNRYNYTPNQKAIESAFGFLISEIRARIPREAVS